MRARYMRFPYAVLRQLPITIGLLVCAMTLPGCQGGFMADLPFADAFDTKAKREREADLAKYGPVSWQRIEQLKAERSRVGVFTSESDEQQALASLARQLRSETDPLVRLEIVKTVTKFKSSGVDNVLQLGLQDADVEVRVACCDALGERKTALGTQLLADVLGSDTSIDVRLAATRALGNSKDPAAVDALALALEDANPALQYRAVQSLKQASGENLGDDVNAWRQYAAGARPAANEQPIASQFRRLF